MLMAEGEVGDRGCVIRIELRSSSDEELVVAGSLPTAVCEAIVDTGADVTCITPEVAELLWLEAHEAETVRTPLGPEGGIDAPIYRVEIALVENATRAVGTVWLPLPFRVIELPLRDGPISALIGRDVLSWVRLDYDGPNGRFSITSD